MDLLYTDDFETYTRNPYSPFLLDHNTFSHYVVPYNGVYYAFSAAGGLLECDHTSLAPENWTTAGFTADATIANFGSYFEDFRIEYDGSQYWYLFCVGSGPLFQISYSKMDGDLYAFPGAGHWSSLVNVSLSDLPPWASSALMRTPEVYPAETGWYMTVATTSITDVPQTPVARWIPDWILTLKSATLDGTWIPANLDNKYKQNTTSAGFYKSYLNNKTFTNAEIIAEVFPGADAGDSNAGIIFRYSSAADTGYYADLYYNSGAPQCRLFKFTGSSLTSLATAVSIPNYPAPQLQIGFPARLRVQCDGNNFKVWYSLWGDNWVLAFNVTDATYTTSPWKAGLATKDSNGCFNNWRVREWLTVEPVVGEATEAEYSFSIVTLAATSILSHNATLNGQATGTSGAKHVAFVWDIVGYANPENTPYNETDYTYYGLCDEEDLVKDETFDHVATDLVAGGLIYFRASGNASDGEWVYGEELSFYLPDISNTPSSWVLGIVEFSTVYWGKGAEPSPWVLEGDDCLGNTTNLSLFTLDAITVMVTDFVNGATANVVATAPAKDEVRLTLFKEGDDYDEGLVLGNTAQDWVTMVIHDESTLWEAKLEIGSSLSAGVYVASMVFGTDPVGGYEEVTITFTVLGVHRRNVSTSGGGMIY
jgi:hypothetical protein